MQLTVFRKAIDSIKTGQRIRDRRTKLKMTQAELAARLGFAPSHLCNLEKGNEPWKAEVVKKVERILK